MLPEKPITRVEQYLDRIAGGDNVIPEKPITRIEQYLDHIVKNGGGGGSDNNFTDEYKEKLDGIEAGAEVNVNADWNAETGDAEILNKPDISGLVGGRAARYGVSGIGQAASALTRIWDAVGMRAQVGTDGDNSNVVNDFDFAYPFMRRKCVGNWILEDGRPKFNVQAYHGDDGYTEDGSKGDYVAVECPLCYYYFRDGVLAISGYQHDGFRPFGIFCRGRDETQLIEKVYLPAYALALKNGHAVSLPGLDNEQGHYQDLTNACRTYDNADVKNLATLEPAQVNFYRWALMVVEFAEQNVQTVMYGCAALRSADADRIRFIDLAHGVATGHYASRVVGEYVAITTHTSHVAAQYKATHRILSVTRCNAEGVADSSGGYDLLELEDLGKGYFAYDTDIEYQLAGRPYRTGDCNGVSTPSGSPGSNTNGYYPCKYRWEENPYGNQFKTLADLFNRRVGTGDDDYYLKWYLCLDPSAYTPTGSGKPDVTDLETDAFVELDVVTEHEDYVNGYIKSKKYSADYPGIWIPGEVVGGSATTYYADYAYLVNSPVVRAVRLSGSWYSGTSAGPSLAPAHIAPSHSLANSGGALCFPQ